MSTIQLRHLTRLRYGDALPAERRRDGVVPVFASGGRVGTHDVANGSGPVIVVGRKGSHGSVHWSDRPAFVIDTAYSIDEYSRPTCPRWMYYVLKAANLPRLSQDVGVPGLSRQRVHELPVANIALEPQTAIAAFLDRECDRITAAIAGADRMVASALPPPLELAKAEFDRQPLGRIGYRFSVQLGKMLDEKRVDRTRTEPYLRNANVHWDAFRLADVKEMTFDSVDRARFALRRGDLLVCEGGEPGRAAVWNEELTGCYFQKALHRVRPYADDSTRYLMWALRVLGDRDAFAVDGPGRYTHLTAEMLRAVRVPMPSAAVQYERLAEIDASASRGRQLAEVATRISARLGEYREALITEAVSGQLDVTAVSDAQMDERAHAVAEGAVATNETPAQVG